MRRVSVSFIFDFGRCPPDQLPIDRLHAMAQFSAKAALAALGVDLDARRCDDPSVPIVAAYEAEGYFEQAILPTHHCPLGTRSGYWKTKRHSRY
jgi:hypothetical protein